MVLLACCFHHALLFFQTLGLGNSSTIIRQKIDLFYGFRDFINSPIDRISVGWSLNPPITGIRMINCRALLDSKRMLSSIRTLFTPVYFYVLTHQDALDHTKINPLSRLSTPKSSVLHNKRCQRLYGILVFAQVQRAVKSRCKGSPLKGDAPAGLVVKDGIFNNFLQDFSCTNLSADYFRASAGQGLHRPRRLYSGSNPSRYGRFGFECMLWTDFYALSAVSTMQAIH